MMGCHAWRSLIVCVVQGDDDMPRSTSFDRVCSPRTMVACHVKHCSTLCSFKEEWLQLTLDVVWPCVLHEGNNGMQRPTSFFCVCIPKAMMAYYVDIVWLYVLSKGKWWPLMHNIVGLRLLSKVYDRIATLYVIRPCGLDKGHDGMPCPMYSDHVLVSKGDDGLPCPTSFHCMCCLIVKMERQSWPHLTTCAAQWPCRHMMPDVVWSSVLSKGDDNMPRTTLSDYVYSPNEMMAFHAQRRPIVCLFQGRWWHYHNRHRPIVYGAQGRWWHATPNIIHSCVHSKGNDGMPHQRRSIMSVAQGRW